MPFASATACTEACEIGFIEVKVEFVIPPRFLAAGRFCGDHWLVESEREIAYIGRSKEFNMEQWLGRTWKLWPTAPLSAFWPIGPYIWPDSRPMRIQIIGP
jgi:hypothetical protein